MDEADKAMDSEAKEEQEGEEELTKKHKTTTSYGFSIDSSRIRAVPVEEQSSVLRNLGIDVFDQEEFEQGVLKQVDEAIAAKELEADIKRWEKDLKSVNEEIRMTLTEIDQIERILKGLQTSVTSSYESRRREEAARRQLDNKMKQLKKLEASQKSLNNKLGVSVDGKEKEEIEKTEEEQDTQQNILQDRLQIMKELQKEREQLIETGEMTPFGGSVSKASTSRHDEDEATTFDKDIFTDDADDNDDEAPPVNQSDHEMDSDEYIPDEDELKESWYEGETRKTKSVKSKSSNALKEQQVRPNAIYRGEDAIQPKPKKHREHFRDTPNDDGDDNSYKNRIREEKIKKLLKEQASERNPDAECNSDEETPDMEFDNRMKIPGHIWHKLYLYQQTGVKWLWELHCQHAGGIIGDEMGLGKTIQAIAFLAGLKYSKIGTKKSRGGLGPILIVSPVTVLHQWVSEFHKWAPEFRVAVLHDTGSYQGHKDTLIRKICHANGVLVTSYSGVRMSIDSLLNKHWDYVILDEGHKIRNPDAEITLACKQFRTPHRIILTGTPMQNNLRELWSLFDFVFPGKLGTLPVFMTEFSVPITTGGYANASTIQVQTAYKCACVLRDTINPYLLRRLKKDVKMSLELPDKNEQVLFCRLSEEQRELYQQYLDSREVQAILAGNYKVFPGLIMLRKICNHPDLTSEAGSLVKANQDKIKAEKGLLQGPADEDDGYGDWRRAGKMIVVEALLKMWKAQGHRVLLFSQSRQMLNIMEKFVVSRGYSYRRMDGSTSVSTRQPLVNKFNTDTSIFVFLLTTRVGGLGVNLTGADRVIIYDPDWNPSTDTQARERSWRIGQNNKVTIYRLLTSGTIEEKIYHRQIFKQFLTNRVLKDPKQRRFFKSNDLYELFTLDESYKKQGTETSAIFAGTNCEVKVKNPKKRKTDPREAAQPVKKSKPTVKPTKKSKITKKEPIDDGGAFSIDARDMIEISRAKEADQAEKNKHVSTSEDHKEERTTDDVKSSNDVTSTENSSNIDSREESSHDVSLPAKPNDDITPRSRSYKDVNSGERSNSGATPRDKSAIDVTIEGSNGHITSLSDDVNLGNIVPNTNLSEEANLNNVKNDVKKEVVETIIVDSQGSAGILESKTVSSKEGRKKKKLKASTLSDREIRRLTRIKKNRRKRQKKGKIEGHEIDNLDYHEIYHTESSTDTTDRPAASHNEDAVLTALFRKGGVHSALKHDVIMDSGNPDYSLVESEANRVAQQAVQALKKSRQQCLGARSGVPTWTGVSGLSGHSSAPKPKPKFGKKTNNTTQEAPKPTKKGKEPALFSGAFMGLQTNEEESAPVSSSQLLAKMRARNNVIPEESDTSAVPETEHDSLLAEISQFVTSGGSVPGQATTQEILERFSSKLPRENTAVFRALLRRICDFKRDSNREGVWRLKSDFL